MSPMGRVAAVAFSSSASCFIRTPLSHRGYINVIGHHAVVGLKCQDMKYKAGDNCFLHIVHWPCGRRGLYTQQKPLWFTSFATLLLEWHDYLEMLQEQGRDQYGVPVVREMVQSIWDSFSENRRGIYKLRQWSGS
ncbi:PREDICTED: probable acyl-[acyl-carrier-protein]--UDP-N-acetylglucosamine O-acyltransferase, mitochondrial isoform X1 [Tarenaya hassleriana]|uniref:probable acyl-[acyl-carrier-protein]--UDP-N-acetylglucosamine O-acyltransferase, mitochondrial isoform X1 n=1 Tax=Tarenaya hassleriana TaxID=28532 RepID=UPI00053C343E|nr:PREDICTED: probable acyl-[acyl-carrier-protein]--UDP-N-acetylglucosamine O-acyltransferase, mitochondrial isoform X1 [Tarenaya hassleriana]